MEDLPESDIQIISLVMGKDGGVLLADFAHEYELLYKSKVCNHLFILPTTNRDLQ